MANEEADYKPEKKRFSVWFKISLAWNILTLVFHCFYCVFFLLFGLGNKVVNIILLSLTALHVVMFVIILFVRSRKYKQVYGAYKRVFKVTRKLTLLVNTIVTGGAIINMGVFGDSLLITVLAVIMIANLILNILWLFLMRKVERAYSKRISAVKTKASEFAANVKSIFKRKDENLPEREAQDSPEE